MDIAAMETRGLLAAGRSPRSCMLVRWPSAQGVCGAGGGREGRQVRESGEAGCIPLPLHSLKLVQALLFQPALVESAPCSSP